MMEKYNESKGPKEARRAMTVDSILLVIDPFILLQCFMNTLILL